MSLATDRSLPKRANALSITEDGQTIAVGDKFGDVYSCVYSRRLGVPTVVHG